jgi:hypothetical protein
MSDGGVTRRIFIKNVVAAAGAAAIGGCQGLSERACTGKNQAPDVGQQGSRSCAAGSCPTGNDKLIIPSWYYEQFDADFNCEVPEKGFNGWKKTELEYSLTHTALVSMHAWDTGTAEQYPGWWRCAPYMVRANKILKEVYPELLKTARESGMRVFHVVGGSDDYWKKYPGYKYTCSICNNAARKYEQTAADACSQKLWKFKEANAMGAHNSADTRLGFKRMDFPKEAMPLDNEPIAENAEQLFAVCKRHSINHLIYCGFAINWCLQNSPGGMVDMARYGMICSTIRQATTAVESKESASGELAKEETLWKIALGFGFVFDLQDFTTALRGKRQADLL